jgi:hypothetical protein
VSLIASVPGFNSGPTKLTTNDIEGWSCSVHIAFPAFPADWNPVAVATDTTTQPTCGSDPDTGAPACGQAYVLVSGEGIVATAPDLKLDPTTGTAPVGTTHTVTATVTEAAAPPSSDVRSRRSARAAGDPAVGSLVSFAVSGANGGAVGTCSPNPDCTSDATGRVSFTYTGAKAGVDTINASFTNNNGQTEHATAAQTWVVPPPVISVTAAAPSRTPIVCMSTRRFTIHVQRVHRYHLVSASVFVNGKPVKVTRHKNGKSFTAIVDLRKLQKGTYHVLVVGRSKSGKVRRFTRTYHTCAAKRKGGHPKL